MNGKMTWLLTWQHFFAKVNYLEVMFLEQPQTLGQET